MGYGKKFVLTPGVNFIGRKLGKSCHNSFETNRESIFCGATFFSVTSTVAVTRLGRHANTKFLLAFSRFPHVIDAILEVYGSFKK